MKDIFDVTLNDKPYYLVGFYTISDSYEDGEDQYQIIKSSRSKKQIKRYWEWENSYDYGGAYGYGCIADVFGPFLTHAEAERKANELIAKGRK